MRYTPSFAESLGETRIELASNSYSDSYPLLSRITFRKLAVDLKSQALALAAAILTDRQCGDVFEFSGVRVGSDYAEAIRTVLGDATNIINVDGMNRAFSTGEIDVAAFNASKPLSVAAQGNTPLTRIDWSGDFVDVETRSSNGFSLGAVQTNALYLADAFRVSVAVGLLVGRDRCRRLYVAVPENESAFRRHRSVVEALRIVGVTLELVAARTSAPPPPVRGQPSALQGPP